VGGRRPWLRADRGRRAPALLAAALLLLAACGDDDHGDDGEAVSGEETATTVATSTGGSDGAGDAFPIEVEHALGTTSVPAEPQRVVTVGVTEQDAVLALGVVPVGVTEWYGAQPHAVWPWAQDELGDAEPVVLSASDGLQYERIAELDPDLIIGTNAGLDGASFERLSEIAPTIAHPVGAEAYFSRWDDQARLIGRALGREADMEALIADIAARFAAAAAEHPEFAGTSIVFLQNALHEGNAIAYQDGLSTAFLTDLGFVVPPEIDEFATEGQAYIPLEQLSVLDAADVLLWATEASEDRPALESEPLYGALEEVEAGRLVFTDETSAGAIYFTSVLSLPFVLDHLVPALASTLAGEGPATITTG
jgi:iron complex transport system substrate-binding protein